MREYTTSEIAGMAGIHPNTVRFYEAWGLISKPARRENGYRVFTQVHIRQIQLVRTAFATEVLRNGLRKKMVAMLKAAARLDVDGALLLAQDYVAQIQSERANAQEAIAIACGILSHKPQEDGALMKRKEVSQSLGITMDALRNWEMNGLVPAKRKQNGCRVYTREDMQRLKMIRALRCANYSLEAILRMLRRLDKNPDADMRKALNVPGPGEDMISVCDTLLVSLDAAEENARKAIDMLQAMKA